MAEAAKIPKGIVLYEHKKDTRYKCQDCVFAKNHANNCAIYGAGVAIKPFGSCRRWSQKKGSFEIPYLGGYTKVGTGYEENPDGFGCIRCDEFLPEENDCKKIDKDSPGDDPGQILAQACCNRWEKLNSTT